VGGRSFGHAATRRPLVARPRSSLPQPSLPDSIPNNELEYDE